MVFAAGICSRRDQGVPVRSGKNWWDPLLILILYPEPHIRGTD